MPRYTNKSKDITLTYTANDLVKVEILAGSCFHDEKDHIAQFLGNLDTEHWMEIKTPAVDEKIALFCHAYSAYTLQQGAALNYKVSKVDVGLLKNLEMDENLVRVFFTTDFWTKTKNVSNYNKHINEIKEIALTGKNPNSGNRTGGGEKGDKSLADALRERYQQ